MFIYNVVNHLDQNLGTYTSRDKAVRMAESLGTWFADKTYFVEEIYYEPV